jgi:hypothetical protein
MTNCIDCGRRLSKEKYIRCHKCNGIHSRGENHYLWKGDKVGYAKLHEWIRKYKPKPELCEICNTNPSKLVANISGKYLRHFNDFKWLCGSCHNKMDGLARNLKNGLRPHPNLGKHLSIKTRKRISESHKRNYINGMIHPNLGKHWKCKKKGFLG